MMWVVVVLILTHFTVCGIVHYHLTKDSWGRPWKDFLFLVWITFTLWPVVIIALIELIRDYKKEGDNERT